MRAEQAGAVNTLVFNDNEVVGDNTDGVGLLRDIMINLRYPIKGKRVLLLGAGGASRGVVGPLLGELPESFDHRQSHGAARPFAGRAFRVGRSGDRLRLR